MRARSLVCGVDFSTASAKALRTAAAIAHRSRGRLLVVFVQDALLAAASKAAGDRRGSRAAVAAALDRFVERSLRGVARPRSLQTAVAIGSPAAGILQAAQRRRADLVVLGTRGIGRAARLILGSTADAVLRRAKVPVLAVPS